MAEQSKTKLKKQIAEQEKHIETMHRIMSNCHSDEAYRNYAQSLNQFIAKKIKLEQQLAQLQ